MTKIYALYSTRDGRVRHVGQSGDHAFRFKEHLRSASMDRPETLCATWTAELVMATTPACQVLAFTGQGGGAQAL
jgi:hypothetical protein